jgi:glycosyltransferase involved in cell wall biosynthesis
LVISRWLQRLMAEEYGDQNTILVPNGVDKTQFDAPPRDKASVPTVGMLYSPRPLKGCATAFKALKMVQDKLPDLRVVAFGARAFDEKERIGLNIDFVQAPPQSMIPELYRSADCWIVSSTTEGFGMPGIEAAACRCPIVSTRCGGPEDYVIDGVSGYLVEVNNAEEMAQRIVAVLTLDNDAWRDMSEASYRKASEFDWNHSAKLMETGLLSVLKNGIEQ